MTNKQVQEQRDLRSVTTSSISGARKQSPIVLIDGGFESQHQFNTDDSALPPAFQPKHPSILAMSLKAEVQRRNVLRVQAYLKSLEQIVYGPATEEDDLEKQIRDIALKCTTKFPFKEYQASMNENIGTEVDEILKNPANRGASAPSGAAKRKAGREALPRRIENLNLKGLQELAGYLLARIWVLGQTEAHATDPVIALAYGEIVLENTDQAAVRLVVSWMYRNSEFNCTSAEQLYKVLTLAERLDMRNLVEICLSKLASATAQALEQIKADGVHLRGLVRSLSSPEPDKNNISPTGDHIFDIRVLFKYVICQENPPPNCFGSLSSMPLPKLKIWSCSIL
ncbi:hypothetical protein EJ04DRAFT_553770 [Polyplosphaeria fusca]|uniref:BTB domain-containing protein n=1 Tax=Polyplosphaeria fusca TaxID=682080 RepID=A0A9P4V1A3_9PLEO|nr:hypothetical protein EJ04DRAFT_553770 [Polyplosphaeria fusca]